MPQRYRVRLGDGTSLDVDLDGLKSWSGDRRALVQVVGSPQWRPLADVLAEEEQQAKLLRALIRPQPRQAKTPEPPEPPAAPVAGPAWETPAASAPWEPSNPGPAWGETPAPAPAWEPPSAPPAWEPPARPSASSGDSAFGVPTRFDEPSLGNQLGLQVLADEPASARAAEGDGVPAIRLKAVDDAPEFKSAWSDDGEALEDEPANEDEQRRGRLDGPLLTLLEKLGGVLSRVLTALAPRLRGVSLRPARAAASARSDEADERPSLSERVAEWLGRLRPHAREDRPVEDAEDAEDADVEPLAPEPPPRTSAPRAPLRAPRPPSAIPSEPLAVPPPPLSALPVVPLAPSREPRAPVDVYDGEGDDDGDEGFSISLRPLWLWTKSLLAWGALAAAVAYAVLERDTWFPKAADAGQAMFAAIDRQVLSRERAEQQRQALATASAQLPGLAPETILLVFARNPRGVEEAPEVFQVAREAADRGRDALSPAETEELGALEKELVAALSPRERALVAEYDAARTRRVIFPFENPQVMELVARGVLMLPVEKRERLQALTHTAVVAGIDRPAVAPSAAP